MLSNEAAVSCDPALSISAHREVGFLGFFSWFDSVLRLDSLKTVLIAGTITL